jgi:membrane-associated phospholipid phosphatase
LYTTLIHLLKNNSTLRDIIIILFISHAGHATGQTPTWNPKREIGIAAGLAAWTTLNYSIQFQTPTIPRVGNTWQVKGLDATAKKQYLKPAARLSDGLLLVAGLAACMSYKDPIKRTWAIKTGITLQSAWMSANLAHSVKMLAKRNRPYTQASNFTYTQRDDVYSFFSGHSALAASLVTSAFLMRNTDTKISGKLWVAGGLLAGGATMYLRFHAGKHYPSDILAGLIVGAGIAVLNYKIHD